MNYSLLTAVTSLHIRSEPGFKITKELVTAKF